MARVADVLRAAKRGLVVYDERILVGQDADRAGRGAARAGGAPGHAEARLAKPLALAAAANSRGAAEMGAHGGWLAGGVPAG